MMLRFNREELLGLLVKCEAGLRRHPDAYTRSVLFDRDPKGDWWIYVRAAESHFRSRITVLNQEDRLERPFVVELKAFAHMIKASPRETVTILEQDRKLHLEVLSGIVGLESFGRMTLRIRDEEFWKDKAYPFQPGNTASLLEYLSLAQKAITFAPSPEHKKICVSGGCGCMNFGNVAVVVKGVDSPNFALRAVDIPVLKKALLGSESFGMQTRLKDYLFQVGPLELSFPVLRHTDLVGVKTRVDPVQVKHSLEIDLDSLGEVVGVLGGISNRMDLVVLDVRTRTLFAQTHTKTGRKMEFTLMRDLAPGGFAMKASVEFLQKLVALFSHVGRLHGKGKFLTSVGVEGKISFVFHNVCIASGVPR